MSSKERPDGCKCAQGDEMACAPCFFAGFDSPNPDAPETRDGQSEADKKRFHADCGGRLRAQARGPLYQCEDCGTEIEMDETDKIETTGDE